ncbi:MAG: LysE family transporter [Christensenellaceae bacterium]|jgi:L-lysine exporter family protein LysE/ArgO|nr:LysE family transporter [Christensenellaceae bacterium]MBS5878640.1 LysE family transporter [Clostridium sp.]MCI5915807.1 LysE family transporter [Christensenella sp.]PWM61007.1 MAG: L-lysine permease [Clostridia bacterium]
MEFYLQGLTIGLAYVAPIGLQNLFVINSALTQKRGRAYLTALIVTFFDVTLMLACFFGVGALMERFRWLQLGVLLVGSLIVCWIGIGLLRSKATLDTSRADVNMPVLKLAGKACVVTWFNPQALIDGTMLFGAFHASLPAGLELPFVMGAASASILWFSGITTLITLFSAKFNDKVLRVINIVCGCVIIFYGLKLLYNFIQMIAG